MEKLTKYCKKDILLAATIFFSNLTYMPTISGSRLIDIINYSLWILIFLVATNFKLKYNKQIIIYLLFLFIFNSFIFIMEILGKGEYLSSRFFYAINLSIFILYIGFSVGKNINSNVLGLYSRAYVFSAILLAIDVYLKYYKGTNWFTSVSYLFHQKNGVAQVFLFALVFLTLNKNSFKKIYREIFMFIFILMLVIVKSRATLIGLLLLFIYLFYKLSLKNKFIIFVISTSLLIYLYKNTNFIQNIILNFVFNNNPSANINYITSGRIDHFKEFLINFPKRPILGFGSYYLESFPLATLMTYGILGSIVVFILAILPLVNLTYSTARYDMLPELRYITIILWWISMVNGIFEELAPFGPGVKCYLLWLLCGIYIRYRGNLRLQ